MSAAEPTVLVADDLLIMRQLLAKILRELGFKHVLVCANAQEIEAAYRGHAIDLAFLDIQMPEKDGLQVLQELLAAQPSVFPVMVSGIGSLDVVQAALKLGARAFVVKPYTHKKLQDAIEKYRREVAS